jgi:TolB-like protein/DNA-binding winged helix-turn-helix (wHTH) protein
MDTRARGGTVHVGDFRFDRQLCTLWRRSAAGDWERVPLGSRASELLAVLTDKPGEVVPRDTIMDAVWPSMAVEPNNLAVQIAALRRVLDGGGVGDSSIETVQGRGYRLNLSVDPGDVPSSPALPLADTPAPDPTTIPPIPVRRRRPIPIGGFSVLIAAVLLAVLAWQASRFSSTPEPPRLSLAVFPFQNLGADAADDYLVMGITDGLTAALSHIPGAFVISRTTADSYRGKSDDIRRIGRELGVRYAVRGSVQRFGPVLRVNAELGSTETGAQLWSSSFDQKIADLASGQEEIVIRMRSALNIGLADIEAARSLRERPTNPDAFDFILRARAIELLPQMKDTVAKTLQLYEKALERDSDAVLALTGAANAVLSLNFIEAIPHEVALGRAEQYLGRARTLDPNSEAVLGAQAAVLDWQGDGLDWRRAHAEVKAVGRKLIYSYPNQPVGYFRLAVVARQEGRYDEAVEYLARSINLNPQSATIKNLYWNIAYCNIRAGHDREGLDWADRAIVAQGDLPSLRVRLLLSARAVAYFRTGQVDTAKRLVVQLNGRYPYDTWRAYSPNDPDSEREREQIRSYQDALKEAGHRDHLDPDVDFSVTPDDVLHSELEAGTPTMAPGVTTLNTERLAAMLNNEKPLVIDTMDASWYRSVPGAVGLDFNGNTHGTFTDAVQRRLEQKLHVLTGGDMAKPIVAMGFNVARFDSYNLALRIRHAGYVNVYWYRGGREAWEVAGKPKDVVRPSDW